ncbi:hypothetical protein [Ideonella sp. A 288]|uniref:hypothetical protein n=1 Tax=Ideonella sp. A 288 TaxID=1962181 RepID=UPI000B4B4455|nr:hypothetical protein [Ideonella sp. A 288]
MRILLVILGAIGALLSSELVLQLLPVSTATARNYHIDPLVLTYPPGHRWSVATGWDLRNAQTLKANNLGFASDIDFVPNADAIALIGDSYVEASMLDASDRPGPQLASAIRGQRPVYAFGAPGSALLDYAERIRLASTRLGVVDFVLLLEAGDVRQSLCGSGNVHGPCLDPETFAPKVELYPQPSTMKRLLSQSALAQYLVSQLKVDARRLPGQLFSADAASPAHGETASPVSLTVPPEDVAEVQRRERMVRAVADRFFGAIGCCKVRKLVLVVDGQRTPKATLSGQELAIAEERRLFMEIARRQGAVVIDAEPLYRRHFQGSRMSLDVAPDDGHLNSLGVRIVTDAAAGALK